MSEHFRLFNVCSSAKIIVALDVIQLLMFVGTFDVFGTKFLITFYNCTP